jgi:uncharacterized membrane protein
VDESKSIREIEALTGYSRPTIHRRLRELGKLKLERKFKRSII